MQRPSQRPASTMTHVPLVIAPQQLIAAVVNDRSLGVEAKEILIWPLGGLAYLGCTQHAKTDLLITLAGPATHIPMAIFWGLVLWGVGGDFRVTALGMDMEHVNIGSRICAGKPCSPAPLLAANSPRAPHPAAPYRPPLATLYCLPSREEFPLTLPVSYGGVGCWAAAGAFMMQLSLFVFNLGCPAYPLDGGRVLIDLLCLRGVAPSRAAVASSSISLLVGATMCVYGLVLTFW